MRFVEKTLTLGAVGLVAGVILGLVAPPRKLVADEGCKCNDSGTGSYQCNSAQTACDKGSQHCKLDCEE